jgi:hypothetical protein
MDEKQRWIVGSSTDPRHVRLVQWHGDSFFQTTVQASADPAAEAMPCGEEVEIEWKIAHGRQEDQAPYVCALRRRQCSRVRSE